MTTGPQFNIEQIDALRPIDLRSTESMKWTMFPSDHIGLFVAEMDFGTAPPIQKALHALVDQQAYGYMPSRFARELSEACATWQKDVNNWDISAESVFPIVDVIAALEHTITHFSRDGSAVIVPTPAYMPFRSVPQSLGRDIIEVPMVRDSGNRWVLDLEGVAAAFQAGGEVLILCNPQNPTGRVHDVSELRALAQVVEANGGRVFSDEIHGPLVFPGHKHIPYASVSDAAARHTITATATSKAWNTPGLKCAQVILSNDADLEKWQKVAGISMYGASNFGAVASTVAYNDSREWLSGAIAYLEKNRDLISEVLTAKAPAVSYDVPEGTYLAWIDFRETSIADSPGDALRHDAKVVLSDGESFGEPGRGWARLNFATPTPILEEALERIVQFSTRKAQ